MLEELSLQYVSWSDYVEIPEHLSEDVKNDTLPQ